MATRFRNVVVFGDSLSDIGRKVKTKAGWFAKKAKKMTTNPSGRFSDCRNWTDHMYEEASGLSLMKGDVATCILNSTKHQSFGADSQWKGTTEKEFRFANYAEGGACGDKPHTKGPFLGTMKDQVKEFKKDYGKLRGAHGQNFLFLVWFGANDLFTAGLPASKMGSVAVAIAQTQRAELATIVGAQNCKFLYVNLALPLSATRYQLAFDRSEQASKLATSRVTSAQGTKKDLAKIKEHYKLRMSINNFESGVGLFNYTLSELTGANGDKYVDMAKVVSKEFVSKTLRILRLETGSQPVGTSNAHVTSDIYDKRAATPVPVTTSDDAHPTDRIYFLMWRKIRIDLMGLGYTFGNLPS